jgi:hypothetical protein
VNQYILTEPLKLALPYMQPTTVFASEEKAQALRGKLSV